MTNYLSGTLESATDAQLKSASKRSKKDNYHVVTYCTGDRCENYVYQPLPNSLSFNYPNSYNHFLYDEQHLIPFPFTETGEHILTNNYILLGSNTSGAFNYPNSIMNVRFITSGNLQKVYDKIEEHWVGSTKDLFVKYFGIYSKSLNLKSLPPLVLVDLENIIENESYHEWMLPEYKRILEKQNINLYNQEELDNLYLEQPIQTRSTMSDDKFFKLESILGIIATILTITTYLNRK